MKLKTIGQIKTIDLTKTQFTIEPIAAYKFELAEGDEGKWKIVFKDSTNPNLEDLKLCDKDMNFKFDRYLISTVVMLKQSKTKVEIIVDDFKDVEDGAVKNAAISIP